MANLKFIDTTNNSVLAGLLDYFDSLILESEKTTCYGIYNKGCEIPISFVDIPTMDKYRDQLVQRCKEDFEQVSKTVKELMDKTDNQEKKNRLKILLDCPGKCVGVVDYLGLYFSKGEDRSGQPEIWICYDKIANLPDAANLTAKVIVHELAHAIMDIKPYTFWNRKFYVWMEEPMANKIALEYMAAAQTNNPTTFGKPYDVSRAFMKTQPSNYSYGVNLYDHERNGAKFDWQEWGNAKGFQHQKIEEQIDWLIEAQRGTASNTEIQTLFDNIVNLGKNSQYVIPIPEDNKIFYETTDGQIAKVRCNKSSGNKIKDHTYGNYGMITFEKPLDYIEEGIFRHTNIKKIFLPNSVTEIREAAFRDCSSLEQITIPNSVKEIGVWAFGGCSNLQQITIPDSVTEIGENAFFRCSSLQQVTIPNSLIEIVSNAFGDCSSLQQITFSNL